MIFLVSGNVSVRSFLVYVGWGVGGGKFSSLHFL